MIIKTWRDPYDAGFSPTTPRQIDLHPGLTVLVGCNGSGKSTLLLNIKEECRNLKIPCHLWDNLVDGGSHNSLGSLLGGYQEYDCDDYSLAMSIFNASEGEAIKLNIGRDSTLYKEFLKSGHFKNRDYRMSKLFSDEADKADKEITDNRRVFLFDAADSGLSIDSVCEVKSVLNLILKDSKKLNLETYIIIAANEYELARDEDCFDINKGEYIKFADYEEYRKFILLTRKRKEARIKRQEKWMNNKAEKELAGYEELKKKVKKEIKELSKEYPDKNSMIYRRQKEYILDKLKEYKNKCKYAVFDD